MEAVVCVASGDGTESQGMDPKRVPSNGSSTADQMTPAG